MTTPEKLLVSIYDALKAQKHWQKARNTYSRTGDLTDALDVTISFAMLTQKLQKVKRLSQCYESENHQKTVGKIVDLLQENSNEEDSLND